MLKRSQMTPAQLRAEFSELSDDTFIHRAMLAAAVTRTVGWLHLQEKKQKVPPYILVGSARLYRKKDVLAYFFKVHSPEVSQ